MKYTIQINFSGHEYINLVAENEEEAKERALELFNMTQLEDVSRLDVEDIEVY